MLGSCLEAVRREAPLIHCITNYVTVNDVANVLLACGASPVMADDPGEAGDVTARCAALTLNLGTLHQHTLPAMEAAARRCVDLGRPLVLDPVGAGGAPLRTRSALQLLDQFPFTAVRGNISELRALTQGTENTRGVDAALTDAVSGSDPEAAAAFAKAAARRLGAIVSITGSADLVSDGTTCYVIRNGRPEMRKITGTGCQLSALTAAFLSANPDRPLEAAAAAAVCMGVAGEIGWSHLAPYEGNATYRCRIIDAVFHMDGPTLDKGANYELR